MYKIKHALKKGKPILIVILVLWILLSIVLIAPLSVGIVKTEGTDKNVVGYLFENMGNIGENLKIAFSAEGISIFGKGELYLVIALLFLGTIGILKAMPKNEYTDIEHGSSDWATGGEQYSILSPKKGIILAEKNYLPVDKRGNVNVLVVGRFWFW